MHGQESDRAAGVTASGKPRKTSLYLIVFLVATTVVTAISSLMSYRELVRSAEDSLRLQAFGIAVSIEAYLLRWDPGRENIFRDMITESTWEAIAFLSLFDHEGTTLLHSNDGLIGKKVDDQSLRDAMGSGRPITHRRVLGTGEEVFILDLPIVSDTGRRLLRLALHMRPTEAMLKQAHLHLATMGILTITLWVVGLLLITAARRSEALEVALREKERLAVIGEMASVLAHEIRNPLGSIKGFAQYLLETPPGADAVPGRRNETASTSVSLPEGAREYLEIIVTESRRLENLTEDMLVYARPHEVRWETFDVEEFMRGLLTQMRGQPDSPAGRVDLDIRIPPGLTITTDRDKLGQIMTNVLQNSMDALRENGRIEVRAEWKGGATVIAVKDNGSGMDKDTLRNAFRPFFTTKTRGTGLGLAIVEKLVRALDGSITIESTPLAGTSLEIRIPNAPKRQRS